ncbi:Phospholipase D1 [Microbotryomycetes sp. JL221]|nr:Phospholipase D1 [Microbotryomycetes sp. JL221]
MAPDLAEVALKAHKQLKNGDGDVGNGDVVVQGKQLKVPQHHHEQHGSRTPSPSGRGVQALKEAWKPSLTLNKSNNLQPDEQHSKQKPSSSTGPTPQPRPRHRSQASFDWFGDSQQGSSSSASSVYATPRTDTPGAQSRSGPAAAASGNWIKHSGLANETKLTESPSEERADFEWTKSPGGGDANGAASSTTPDRNQSYSSSGASGGLRGAFTLDDKQRGMRVLRGESTDSDGMPSKPRRRSTSMDGPSPTPRRARRSTSLGRERSRGTTQRGLSGDDVNEYDENRDAFDGDADVARRKDGSGGPRKPSLWGGAANFFATMGTGSGTNTPDDRSVQEGEDSEEQKRATQQRKGSAWGVVRNKLAVGKQGNKSKPKAGEALAGTELLAELTLGILPMVLVKMSLMDRDERGDRRIPILMNYLKLRITDSVYPFHDRHAVFRIELEYGDAAVKWVIYRELKDFLNLHAHYRVANLRSDVDKFPAFPKTSLPYLNWLQNQRGHVGKAEFARSQREALEEYLLKLIRATMFRPEANRLCKFLEISAMSLSLSTLGGAQGKQGYLSILSAGASRRKPPGFHPMLWKYRHEPKWFIIRDSYIVAVDDPASLDVYDVILVDYTFELERPKRLLRQGLNLVTGGTGDASQAHIEIVNEDQFGQGSQPAGFRGAGDPNDPSTTKTEHSHLKDSSNHTFYIRTSERKLRLVAKTERQQDQFIASIEKMLSNTIWAGENRFQSFAPIRLNASAQWLIDGRDYYWSLSRAILLAKHRIFIHDWWLSPELYLRRPPAENEHWRLDRLLQRKAEEGVQIFVIVYKEVSNDFTPVDSNYTKTRLRGLHPNIHVQRSPDHKSTGTLFWSHHEKMCVIDETIGFMGGFDLCFGRWDTPGHVLVDDGPAVVFDAASGKQVDDDMKANSQIWPGKDYLNQRVLDFHTLNKPEEDMYDRSKVPRQPWHDIGLQIIGQPARDLCRHFIQRWNYLLRTKNHTVKMPFLIPSPDFTPKELQEQRITGTCEMQICRSVGPWSMGISHVEHSIQNAYCKAIQLSDHFVYIENQFFITSTEVEGTEIENRVGDALVSRIIRAATEGTPWRAIIVIPLIPGYPYPLDHADAGSVRMIMECQFASICRGQRSIFGRLRREGIDPDEYISFYSLRGWGKLSTGALTTEGIYIHAKAMVVDDRTVIIGSANLNERSQRGDRDSELACVIRDTDMIDSTMAGQPYKVSRFAHTMRIRLMREHLGVDVDELELQDSAEDERPDEKKRDVARQQRNGDIWDPDHEQQPHGEGKHRDTNEGILSQAAKTAKTMFDGEAHSVVDAAKEETRKGKTGFMEARDKIERSVDDKRKGDNQEQQDPLLEQSAQSGGEKILSSSGAASGFASTVTPTLEETVLAENRPLDRDEGQNQDKKDGSRKANRSDDAAKASRQQKQNSSNDQDPYLEQTKGAKTTMHNSSIDDARKLGSSSNGFATPPEGSRSGKSSPTLAQVPEDEKTLGSPNTLGGGGNPETAAHHNKATATLRKNLREKNVYTIPIARPKVDAHKFTDPLVDGFYKDVWAAAAVRNTHCFRKVFRCIPDDLVQTWRQYREFQAWAERHNKAPRDVAPSGDDEPYYEPTRGHGVHGAGGGGSAGGVVGQGEHESNGGGETLYQISSKASRARASSSGGSGGHPTKGLGAADRIDNVLSGDKLAPPPTESRNRERSGTLGGEGHDHENGFPEAERQQMEKCLREIQGTLVIFPTRFLEAESLGGNFL